MARHRKKKFTSHKLYLLLSALVLLVSFACIVVSARRIKAQNSFESETPEREIKTVPYELSKEREVAEKSTAYHVPILLYHYVEYVADRRDVARQSLNIPPDIFEEQIKTLKAQNYTFMTAYELGLVLNGEKFLPPKPVLITFDDGHDDFYTVVFPILKKYNIKSTQYVITNFLNRPDFMTRDQLQEVIDSGLVDVGSHTMNHIWLKDDSAEEVKNEVFLSKKFLEEYYHVHIFSFAYPFGALDKQSVAIVKQAGYTTAVSTIPGTEVDTSNQFFIFRLRPGYRVGTELTTYIDSEITPMIEKF